MPVDKRNDAKIVFDSVIFDKDDKVMTILNGSKGTYSYKDIKKCSILNEKAKYHKKSEPFSVTVPNGPLPVGMISEPSLYVGLKLVMNDDHVLAIYTSKEATNINTDVHIKDREEAKEIKAFIDKVIAKYQPQEKE